MTNINMKKRTAGPNEHLKILLYLPNIIDYCRYILSLKAMYHAFNPSEWQLFIKYYYLAIFLDVIDGECARLVG